MRNYSARVSVVAVVAAMSFAATAHAADFGIHDPVPVPHPAAQQLARISGNVAIWGQIVSPSGYSASGYEEELFGFDLYEGTRTCDSYTGNFWGGPASNFCQGDWGFGGDARAHYDFGTGHAIQLEMMFDYHRELDSEEDDEDDAHSIHGAAGGHLIFRQATTAFGLFAGLAGTAHLDDDDRSAHAFGGGEAAAFMNNSTLFGQLGYATAIAGDDGVGNLIFGRVGARHFFTPNTRLEGSLAYGYSSDAEIGDGETMNWLQLAANIEHQLDQHPISFFAGYQGDHLRVRSAWDDGFWVGNEEQSTWVHTLKAGVRLSFGGTLQHEDRYGARTFDFTNLRAPLSYADDL